MRRYFFPLVAILLVLLAAWGFRSYQATKDFTPWMSLAELNHYMAQFDTTPPGSHPNYWDHGHWINAVEGRWYNGIPQYRILQGPVPAGHAWAWYWYINQDQQSFSKHVHELADDGFVLVDPNSYRRPDDSLRYQGVWHKLMPQHPAAATEKPDPQ